MEKQKLIYVESKAQFSPSEVSDKAIVFIKDTKEIWTHGVYFSCSGTWATPITLSLTGDTTGSVSIDGSGNVSIATTTNYLSGTTSITDVNNAANTQYHKIAYYAQIVRGASNLFPVANNANAILSLNVHDYSYTHQLGFSSNGNIYHRRRNGGTWETSWKTILNSSNYTNFPHTFASLTNKPTTLSGYGITDCIPIISGGKVTTDTDLSTLGMTTAGAKLSVFHQYEGPCPTWLNVPYMNVLMFRSTSDSYGAIGIEMWGRTVQFIGGRNLETASNNVPNWWFRIKGASGTTYDLNSIQNTINNLDNNYLRKSGGTMTGALNFANNTWNKVGDDAYMGDCNVAGMIGIKGSNAATPGFAMYNDGGTLLGKLYASGTSLYWSDAKILTASGTSKQFVMGDGSLYSNTVSYTTWDKTTTSGIAWFPIADITDNDQGTALFMVRGYAHSSIIFTVTKGSATGNINVLAGGGDFNNSYAYIKGVRQIGTVVEIGLNAAATLVKTTIKVIQPTFIYSLRSSLVESTSTTTPYVQYELNTNGSNHNFGIVSSKFTGNLIGNADTASKWKDARTITLTGDVTGSVSLDGSSNVTLTTTTSGTGTTAFLKCPDKRNSYPAQIVTSGGKVGAAFIHKSMLGGAEGVWYDAIILRGYVDNSAGNENALLFSKNSSSVYHSQYTFGSTTTWGTMYKFLDSNNYSSYALPLSGGTMTGNIILTTGSSYIADSSTSSSILGAFASGNTAEGLSSEAGVLVGKLATQVTIRSNGDDLWHYRNSDKKRYKILDAANYTNYTINYANSNINTYGSVGVIANGKLYYNNALSFARFIQHDNSGRPSYELIAELPNYDTGANTSYITYGISGFMWAYRGGNGANSGAYPITAIVNVGPAVQQNMLRVPVTTDVLIPLIVKYDDKYYIALKKQGSSTTFYFMGIKLNLLTTPIIVDDASLIEEIKGPETETSTAMYYYNNGTPQEYLHAGNYKNFYPIKLLYPRTLWGQSFDGTANVNGAINIVRDSSFVNNYTEGVRIQGAANEWAGIFLGTNGTASGQIATQWNLNKTASDTFRISRGATSTSLLEILNSGNVGIGTSSPTEKLQVSGNVIVGTDSANSSLTIKSKTQLGVAYLNFDNGYFVDGAHWQGYIAVSGWGDSSMKTEGYGLPGKDQVVHGMIFKLPRTDMGGYSFRNGSDQDIGYLSRTGQLTVKSGYIVSGGTSSQFLKADGSLDSTSYLKVDGSNGTSDGVSTLLNKLTTGSSTPTDADYYICQYAGGGTTTTTYVRRPMSALYTYIKSKLSLNPDERFIYATSATSNQYGTTEATGSSSTLTRTQFWRDNNRSMIGIYVQHSDNLNYGFELGSCYGKDALTYKRKFNGTWGTLQTVLTSNNYNSYSPTLTGTGASGTWAINISGVAASASKVANALTIQLNGGTTAGTNKFVYDGSSAYTINITPEAIGASATSHTHSYLPLSGGTLGSTSATQTELRLKSSTTTLRLLAYSDTFNYIQSGNADFNGSAPLHITGYNGTIGSDLYLKFTNIYCRSGDYTNIDSGNYSSYALPLSGGTLTGTINCKAIVPITDNGYSIGTSSKTLYEIHANFFKRRGSSNDYVLLGGGEHKLISDFVQNYTAVVPGGSVGNNDSWTLILNNNYSTGWYNPCTMFYIRSHNFGCGILCFYHYWDTSQTSGYYDNSVWFFGAEHSAYSGTMGGTDRDINNFLKVYIDKDNDNLKIYYNRYNNQSIYIQELQFSQYQAGTLYPKGQIRASHFITNGAVTDLPITSSTFVNIPIQTTKNHTEDIKTTRSVYASAFYENSDIRLKENVHSIDQIDLLKNVDLVQFNFKNDQNKKYGVIAQQLEQVGLQNLVYENNGNKAVDYISLLVLEIQRLRNEIGELKQEINKKS